MRTFGVCGIDSVLRDIDDEIQFNARLRDNYALDPSRRKMRLSALAANDSRNAESHDDINRWLDNQLEEKVRMKAEEEEESGAVA